VYSAYAPQLSLIFMNLRDEGLPFFREKRVRQALLLGLNRQRMVDSILNGQAVVARSPILPGSWAFRQDLPTPPYDPLAAASLLNEAGWLLPPDALPGTETFVRAKEGVTFGFTLVYPNTPTYAAIAQAAQANWAALGVRVALTSVEPAALRAQYLEPRAFQAILVDYSLTGTPDPDPYPLWHQTQIESGQNYSGLDDRITSQYLEEARITTDLAVRARTYQSFQSRFADLVPALVLYVPVYNYGVNRSITNISLGALTTASDRLNTIVRWQLVAPQPVQGAAGPGGQP
jgi:peptide/nickel transport system substrate-binding protein